MSGLTGFIKLHRKILSWGWYQDNVVKAVFLHLLLKAAFTDFTFLGKDFRAGQIVTSRRRLAYELGISEQQIRTALVKLEETQEITINPTSKYTVITIKNWQDFQEINPQSNQQITSNQPHSKNNKNVKNSFSSAPPQLEEIKSYISLNGLNVDAKKFFLHYSDNGWTTEGGRPITDWRRLIRVWDKREHKATAPKYDYAGYDIELFERMLMEDE